MPDPKSDDEFPDVLRGPALGSDGRVERFDRVEPAVPILNSPRPEPLQLEPIAPPAIQQRVEKYRDELETRANRQRSAALKIVIALVLLAGVATVALVVFKPKLELSLPKSDGVSEPTVLDKLGGGERSPMIISSVPTGAKVIIDGETVGETPWAGDNRWTANKVKIRLQAAGYTPWDGEFDGDRPVTLDVKLKR